MTAPAIPITAWEQAVLVCLFIFFVWLILKYMFNHFRAIMESLDGIVERFQKAVEMRDQQFLNGLERRDASFMERNTAIVRQLQELTKCFVEHDAKMEQALEDMRSAKAKVKTQSRGKSQPPPVSR